MILFDLEFYVPKEDRNSLENKGTLVFNPTRSNHRILGGSFILKELDTPDIRKRISLWKWDFPNEEELLKEIYNLFIEEYKYQNSRTDNILKKKIVDIVTVGFAISRIDLMALFIRSQHYKIKTSQRLFEVFLKTKSIDLSNTAALLFPEEPILYPKTTNEVLLKLFPDVEKKKSGKKVWDYYDKGEYKKIENRCEQEVEFILKAYTELQKKLR